MEEIYRKEVELIIEKTEKELFGGNEQFLSLEEVFGSSMHEVIFVSE